MPWVSALNTPLVSVLGIAMMIGRAHSTLTLVLFILIFGLQVGIGAMLSRWPAQVATIPPRRI